MSSPKQELGLIKEFRDLYSYVSELGRQFNLMYKRLESLEMHLKEISAKFDESTAVHRNEITTIQQKMFTKSEFNDFISELQITIEETLPTLPLSTPIPYKIAEESSQQTEESPSQSEP